MSEVKSMALGLRFCLTHRENGGVKHARWDIDKQVIGCCECREVESIHHARG